jgi:para-aminobenzoate synthetase component 1
MTISEFEKIINEWGQNQVPFLFIVDFEMEKPVALKLSDIDSAEILFDLNGTTNAKEKLHGAKVDTTIEKKPVSYEEYEKKFEKVYKHLEQGDSYLTNLTIKTEIKLSATLRELFFASKAKYKLLYKDQFLVFSPEIFIQIRNDQIYSYPMKGTINATVPEAEKTILNDKKELAEHVTIVDLIRNDLSQVAKEVRVSRFRYLEEIKTNKNPLFQVSSEIVGFLSRSFSNLGTLLIKLLPAGSVSGAPKARTVEIIRQAEGEERGYYTGVLGIFDGNTLDSGVVIRYIESNNGRFFYRSGGGITTQSKSKAEFEEAIDKIYVPLN